MNPQFIQPSQDWQLESVDTFFEVLYDNLPTSSSHDCVMWLPLKRVFELRSYHNALRGSTCTFFPWKSIWMVKVPSKMVFFVWTAGLLKILIVNNLHKRHILIVDWCCMCKCSGEFIDHLLPHCSMATDKWSFVFTLSWVMPKSVVELFEFWQCQFQHHRGAKVWPALPLCVIWNLRYERNKRVFDGIEQPA